MNNIVSNTRMAAFREEIISQVKELLCEREEDILTAWQSNIEEAHNNAKDKIPPLKLSIGATIDLEDNTISAQLTFTAKYTSTICKVLPDPNQPELFEEEES